MSSAVPYEPDDFDNNPFAEQSIIDPTPHILPPAPPTATQPSAVEEPNTYQPDQSEDTANSSRGEEAELKKPFHDFPDEADIKRYLPERMNRGSFELSIRVREVEKNGNATYRNPVLRLDAAVKNIPGFRKAVYKDVRRTYKELQSIYKYLLYNNIEVFVPTLPVVTTAYNAMSPEFIDSVSASIQDWFNRICANPILIRNQEFVLFLEQNDFGYAPSKTKPSQNSVMATGLRRKTLKQFQPPYDASPGLAEYRPMIKSMHVETEKLVEKLEKMIRVEKQCADLDASFYSKLSETSSADDKMMTKVWDKFNKVMQTYTEMHLVGEVSMIHELGSCMRLISDDCYNIKESLTNRHLLMRELLSAEEATRRKHAVISRLKAKAIIDPVRIDESIRSLEIASNYEKELRYEVKRTTYEMLIESRDYKKYLEGLLKKTFKLLAQQQISQERKKLRLLTTNKLISPQESLGRLGRESLPENVPSSSPSGPSSAGDSWNGRGRRPFEEGGDPLAAGEGTEEISNVDAKSAATILGKSSF